MLGFIRINCFLSKNFNIFIVQFKRVGPINYSPLPDLDIQCQFSIDGIFNVDNGLIISLKLV